jgi:hypothetical protein
LTTRKRRSGGERIVATMTAAGEWYRLVEQEQVLHVLVESWDRWI